MPFSSLYPQLSGAFSHAPFAAEESATGTLGVAALFLFLLFNRILACSSEILSTQTTSVGGESTSLHRTIAGPFNLAPLTTDTARLKFTVATVSDNGCGWWWWWGGGSKGRWKVGKKQHVSSHEEADDSDLDDEEQELHQVADEQGLGVAAQKEKKEKKLRDKKRAQAKAKDAKMKRDQAVGKAAKQMQDGLGALANMMEVLANTITPPKPYP
ncbi:hypothetical protein JCM11641_006827 [Rhodosporidiobolus odoratus]